MADYGDASVLGLRPGRTRQREGEGGALAQVPDPDDVGVRRHRGMVNTIRVELSNNQGDAAQGDVQAATSPLTRALSLAEPAGYVRLFVDEGAVMAKLLRLTKTRGVALDYIDELLAAFPEVEPAPGVPSPQRQGPSPLIEPLTKRERQVLRLLCTGLSNPEIAAELIVATGTVKKHLHNIYGKLGVRNRSQAILRTEELDLLKEQSAG